MDAPENRADLRDAYIQTRNQIITAGALEDADRQLLNEAESELDSLARSKQLGLVLGELLALIIFAGITIGITMFLRPDEEEIFTRFMVDLFAMLVSAVVIFLTVNIVDLHRERAMRQFTRREENGDYIVRFPEAERPLADQWLSIIAGLALVLTYAALLAHKWLGWFS